ncbi:MAG TPA: AcvB/VirJ family lysyl-phosphatidylglycerol hydrolase [Chitinophagaceae bacterium]|nr:AcvB/VirJ family lysyl-phosphatidylglycerol hydrolase [Chitinophagaceae bacterium]
MKKMITLAVAITFFLQGYAGMPQNDSGPTLPVVVLPAETDGQTPMILMITGDGGWKDFDPRLAAAFVREKVPVVALNALHYFWDKKTPAQATAVVESLLKEYMGQWHKHSFILVGYSFGADVMPFIANRLPESFMKSCRGLALFSPGTSTDFEIHISQMLSSHHRWKYDVVKEMEAMKPVRMLCFFGDEEKEFPVKDLTKPGWQVFYLHGGHHYGENDHQNLAGIVLRNLGKDRR